MLALAVLGLAFAVLGWVVDARRFHAGWLAAVTVFVGWPLGSMALLLIHALTGGRWGYVLRPALRVGVLSLPLLLPAVLPLLGGLQTLYPWDAPGLQARNFYLNLPFFEARGRDLSDRRGSASAGWSCAGATWSGSRRSG